MATYTAEQLESLPTLSVGQCCSLKVEDWDRVTRVWLCRVGNGVSIETVVADDDGRDKWRTVAGSCHSPQASY